MALRFRMYVLNLGSEKYFLSIYLKIKENLIEKVKINIGIRFFLFRFYLS